MKYGKFLTTFFLMALCFQVQILAQSAKIDKFWIDLDAVKDGEQGLMGHLKFDVYGMKDKPVHLRLFFYDSNKYIWMCQSNGLNYRTTSGRVCSGKDVYPKYDGSTFHDAQVFMPIRQLQLASGTHNYFCDMYVIDMSTGKTLAESKYIQFSGTGVAGNTGYSGTSKGGGKWGATGAAIGALITGAWAAYLSSNSSSSSSSPSSSSSSSSSDIDSRHEYKGVELVGYTIRPITDVAHVLLAIRNKNNYDVYVRVQLYQGKWNDARITYSDSYTGYISGLNDDNSTDILVKANSLRKLNLKGKLGGGEPTKFRIKEVF